MNKELNSAIYEGLVNHCRLEPVVHSFNYKVFMMFLDLSEVDSIFKKSWLWSLEKLNLACFLRKDFLGEKNIPLDEAVRNKVEAETGQRPTGRICVLTNCRYFGYINNPITCYYCYNEDEYLQYIVAEVTNTPWGERHAYVIPSDDKSGYMAKTFIKEHHVSPFMPMQMKYSWRSNSPAESLKLLIDTYHNDQKYFFASLSLKRKEISQQSLRTVLIHYPFMTLKVVSAIYWQALKLWFKKVPFYPNPNAVSNKGELKQKVKLKNTKGVQH